MAISKVRAQINGTWHNLTLNSSTGAYEATVTAPGATSYNMSGGYYPVTVEVTNTAGTVVTENASTMNSLRLVVKETVKPVITIESPTSGAFVTNNLIPIVFTVTDEAGGSGVADSETSLVLDGTTVSGLTKVTITNGYRYTYTATSALSDGVHTITINAKDNDGNTAESKSATFTVDTVPPVLDVTFPTEGLETNTLSISVQGSTNDLTSSPVTVIVTVNGTSQGEATVNADGSFSKDVTLVNDENTIIVTATDKAGKESTVTRHVTVDTSVPVISSASITPNPVDTGSSMIITVVIE